jgi:NAD-dependent SIR2 family protein deacetylase
MKHGVFVFTSNVDGHFQKTGFADERIAECHGSIHWLQCARACRGDLWSADVLSVRIDETNCRLLSLLPRCRQCAPRAQATRRDSQTLIKADQTGHDDRPFAKLDADVVINTDREISIRQPGKAVNLTALESRIGFPFALKAIDRF